MFRMILALTLLSSAHATTAHVCVRNDGAGTFQPTSLSFFADTYGTENDGSAIGPASALGPGGNECVSISGLRATNVDRPETAYTFRVSWTDAEGTASSTSSPIVLDVDKFVGQAGAHSYYLDPTSYIAVSNAAPAAPGTPTATWDGDASACLVDIPAPTVEPVDFGTYRLERIDDSGVWTEVDAWQHADPYSRADDTLTGLGDSIYRVVAEDIYGARTEGPEGICVGSDAADLSTDTGTPHDTGDTPTTDTGDGSDGGDDGGSDGSGDADDGDGTDGGDPEDTEDSEDDNGSNCATGSGPWGGWVLALLGVVWRGRSHVGPKSPQ
jgi:hypothetical protein